MVVVEVAKLEDVPLEETTGGTLSKICSSKLEEIVVVEVAKLEDVPLEETTGGTLSEMFSSFVDWVRAVVSEEGCRWVPEEKLGNSSSS